jgi:hypothetical protein
MSNSNETINNKKNEMIFVSFVNAFEYIHTMTAPIIQQQQQPSSMQNSNSAETWNNYDWTPQNNLTITSNNTTNTTTNADSNYNSEDYEEMVQEGNGVMVQDDEEGNGMMTQDEEENISDDSSSYTSEDLPELEETPNAENIFENPANSLNWRDRHIERNFCSYNEFHDYITAYHIEYNEYFGLPQQ